MIFQLSNCCDCFFRCLIDSEARYRALKRSVALLGRVIQLARHPALEVALNGVKIATIMAESPEGRKYYVENFAAVTELMALPDPDLRRVAETLVAVTTWLPWVFEKICLMLYKSQIFLIDRSFISCNFQNRHRSLWKCSKTCQNGVER